MYRKHMRILALGLLLILLAGCGAQTEGTAKILMEEVTIASTNLKTAQAQIGDLQREHTTNASVLFAKKTIVRLQADDAQFVEHQVNIGQEVKAGDVLTVFRKRSDNIRLTEIKYELEELETSRTDGLDDRAEQMEELLERMEPYLEDAADGTMGPRSRQQLDTLYMEQEKLQLEQEQFLLRLKEQERKLKQERKKLQEAEEELILTAPVDGIVESVQYMTPGQSCDRGQSIVVLYDPSQLMLVADSGILGDLRMGQQVQLQYGRYDSTITVPGHVVAADNALPADLRTGKAYIALDAELEAAVLNSAQIASALQVSAQVKVTSLDVDLQDVLVVPRDAVQHDNYKAYVEIADGMSTSLRYVQTGPNDTKNIMILTGLDEGAVVINR